MDMIAYMKLLEITHGMWIYRNLLVHDSTLGVLRTQRVEILLDEIQRQLEMGGARLQEEDQWMLMLEVNLGDLATTSGEREAYWLLVIETA